LSGSSTLTCLAWEALPVAYDTASIALGIMWPHKPHHYVKVGIPSGRGGRNSVFIYIWILFICVHLMNNLVIKTNTCISIKNTNKLFIKSRLLNTVKLWMANTLKI
jgi:hypothetical protein